MDAACLTMTATAAVQRSAHARSARRRRHSDMGAYGARVPCHGPLPNCLLHGGTHGGVSTPLEPPRRSPQNSHPPAAARTRFSGSARRVCLGTLPITAAANRQPDIRVLQGNSEYRKYRPGMLLDSRWPIRSRPPRDRNLSAWGHLITNECAPTLDRSDLRVIHECTADPSADLRAGSTNNASSSDSVADTRLSA